MPRIYPNLGAFLKDSRITHEAFAAEMGIASSYVSMLVNGERTPSLPLALRIAERANIPLESLLPADGPSEPADSEVVR